MRVLPVPPGTPLGGYAARTLPATGVLDELEVAAVSLAAGQRRLVWIVADLPCVNTDLVDHVRSAVTDTVPDVRPDDVWVSATHTHAGPETGCAPGGAQTPMKWRNAVAVAAAAATAQAVAAEQTTLLKVHRESVDGVGGQRSGAHPARTVPVDVLRFTGPGGAPHGLIVILPVHPTVLGADNLLVSADLVGAVRRALDAHHALSGNDPRPWVVVATGAAGDVSTRPHRQEQTPAECDRLGAITANAVVRGLGGPARVVIGENTPLRVCHEQVPLASKSRHEPDAVPDLEEKLRLAEENGEPIAIRTAWTALQAARLAAAEPLPSTELSCVVSVARLGPLTLVAVGAEPFLDLAAQLDGEAAKANVLIGYTNGYLGYLPVRAAYRRTDYEVLRSPVAAGSAEHVLARVATLVASTVEPTEEHP